MLAEKKLFQSVIDEGGYDYVHLISSVDMPLMTKDYFLDYFDKDVYLGFSNVNKSICHRISWYYPFGKINPRTKVGKIYIYIGDLKFNISANCRMRLASHWQNKKRHCDVSCIILSDQTKMRRYVQ